MVGMEISALKTVAKSGVLDESVTHLSSKLLVVRTTTKGGFLVKADP